jgi:hypothetical protein
MNLRQEGDGAWMRPVTYGRRGPPAWVGTHGQHGDTRAQCGQPIEHLCAAKVGQAQAERYQRGATGTDAVHRLAAGDGGRDCVVFAGKRQRDNVADARFIVHHQDGRCVGAGECLGDERFGSERCAAPP